MIGPPIIPLYLTVREADDKAGVWFEYTGELPLREGDVVTIVARVHEVKRSGGYERGGIHVPVLTPKEDAGPVTRRESFSLDMAEIFLLDVEKSR